MKVRLLRCVICLGWWSPVAHSHCPYCGAFKLGRQHYAMTADMRGVRKIFSAVHVPLALRNNYLTR